MRDIDKFEFEFLSYYDQEGFHYQLLLNSNPVKFPVHLEINAASFLLKKPFYDAVLTLSALYSEGYLMQYMDQLHLSFEDYFCIPNESREELRLPLEYSGGLFVDSSSYVGSKEFKLRIALTYDNNGLITNYEKKGQVVKIGKSQFVINQDLEKIFHLADEINSSVKTSRIQDLYFLLANLKSQCDQGGFHYSDYLKSQEIGFGEKIDIEVNCVGINEIELRPKFANLEESYQKVIDNSTQLKKSYLEVDKCSRKRVFLADKGYEDFNKIKNISRITGSDYTKFISNPFQFIDEDIEFDREKFSERVKGLKVITYRAKPFINANENEKLNWFEFDAGIELISNDESVPNKTISVDKFKEMLNELDETGVVSDDGKLIDYNADEIKQFFQANQRFDNEFFDHKIEYANIRRVLDIFENVDQLEFKQGAVRAISLVKEAKLDKYEQPKGLNATLFPYQKNGHLWMKSLEYLSLGGLLADDMGLGKTLQVISYMQYLKNNDRLSPALVVLPIALIGNWKSEIEKFSEDITCHIYHKALGCTNIQFDNPRADVYLTTYETLVNKQMVLGKVQWSLLVCDEAQKIKNTTTYAASAAKAMKARSRLALTGTPVENGLHELWSIVDYIQPGLLDSYSEFKKNYELPIQKGSGAESIDTAQKLISHIKSIYLRRTKEEQLEGLPRIEYHSMFVDMTQVQYDRYINILKMGKENPKLKLGLIVKLLQVCDHPYSGEDHEMMISSDTSLSNKLNCTMEILNEIKEKGEKAIIFTKYRNMQRILSTSIVQKYGFYPLVINGEITNDRNAIVQQFSNKGGFNVIILSPRAAGVGLNITSANHVIHFSRDWNPAVEKQATDRVYRIGQNKDVHVYYPIVTYPNAETVEQKLDKLLNRKKLLIEKVIIPSDLLRIKEDELLEVFDE